MGMRKANFCRYAEAVLDAYDHGGELCGTGRLFRDRERWRYGVSGSRDTAHGLFRARLRHLEGGRILTELFSCALNLV